MKMHSQSDHKPEDLKSNQIGKANVIWSLKKVSPKQGLQA